MSGLVQDVNNKATVAEMKADSNTNKINQNKQDIADENSYLRERCSQTREHPRFLFT